MRIPILSMFMFSPLDGLKEHAEKVRAGASAFRAAVRSYLLAFSESFERDRHLVSELEHQADAVKRRIRGHLPKGTLMVVDKFQLFAYVKEQDRVIDAFEHVLDWLSFRPAEKVPDSMKDGIIFMVDTVLEPIDILNEMLEAAKRYFESFSEQDRKFVKDYVRSLRSKEGQADIMEANLKHEIFEKETDPVSIYHMVQLVEMIGTIADHAENAGDMMRAMVAK